MRNTPRGYCSIKSNNLNDCFVARNNITLKHLRAFIAVADKGSFVAAAEALALSQPALSQSVHQLEDQIGGTLFHRTTRHVKLTSLGIGFLPTARHLLRQFDTAVSDIQDAAARKRGRVVVACLPSIASRMMPPVIADVEAASRGVRVIVRDMNLKSIIAAVIDGHADIGIGSFATPGPSLDGLAIARDRFFGVFPKSHPLAALATVDWQDLEGYPFVAMTNENGIRELVDSAVAPRGIRLTVASEVSNLATVHGLLEEGLGVTALPGLALPPENHPFLVYRPLKQPVLERTLQVVWRHGVGLSPAARSIIESITKVIYARRALNEARVEWLEGVQPPFER